MSEIVGRLVQLLVVVAAMWLVLVAVLWLHRPSRELVGPAVRLVPDVARLARAVIADRETPRSVRIALTALLVYLLSPIDLIPEFLPGIGLLDDVILAGLVLRWVGRRVEVERLRAHWSGSADGFELLLRFIGGADGGAGAQ